MSFSSIQHILSSIILCFSKFLVSLQSFFLRYIYCHFLQICLTFYHFVSIASASSATVFLCFFIHIFGHSLTLSHKLSSCIWHSSSILTVTGEWQLNRFHTEKNKSFDIILSFLFPTHWQMLFTCFKGWSCCADSIPFANLSFVRLKNSTVHLYSIKSFSNTFSKIGDSFHPFNGCRQNS